MAPKFSNGNRITKKQAGLLDKLNVSITQKGVMTSSNLKGNQVSDDNERTKPSMPSKGEQDSEFKRLTKKYWYDNFFSFRNKKTRSEIVKYQKRLVRVKHKFIFTASALRIKQIKYEGQSGMRLADTVQIEAQEEK